MSVILNISVVDESISLSIISPDDGVHAMSYDEDDIPLGRPSARIPEYDEDDIPLGRLSARIPEYDEDDIPLGRPSARIPKDDRSKIDIFFELCGYSGYGVSRTVAVTELERIKGLSFGNGGSWCRFDSSFAKQYKVVTRKSNGKLRFSWDDISEEEKKQIERDFSTIPITKGINISHIKVYGTKVDYNSFQRSIRSDIKAYYKDKRCVSCGNSDTEIDHKNGFYNDPRVLKLETQLLSDFQALCRHCNQQKRQSIRMTRETGVRYKATNIPMLTQFGVDYVEGDEGYDESDKDAMVGTYWYDPIEFLQKMNLKLNKR
jgi:5-methylcytosine-specific restriction endonuclease McrA